MDMIPPKGGRGQEKIENMFGKRKEESRGLHPDMQAAGEWQEASMSVLC